MMMKITKWPLFLMFIPLLIVGCSSEPKPSTKELRKTLQTTLPAFWEVTSYEVKVSENAGTKVEPLIKSRFHSVAKASQDLFQQAERLSTVPLYLQNDKIFLRKSCSKDTTVDIYGIATSRLHGESWNNQLRFETNPIGTMGNPQSFYMSGGKSILVRGSSEEDMFISESKKQIQKTKGEIIRAASDGNEIKGEANDKKSTWPFRMKITSIDSASGNFQGQIEWLTLLGITKIEGNFSDSKMSFKEIAHIKKGDVMLECVYEFNYMIVGNRVNGQWGGCGTSHGDVWFDLL